MAINSVGLAVTLAVLASAPRWPPVKKGSAFHTSILPLLLLLLYPSLRPDLLINSLTLIIRLLLVCSGEGETTLHACGVWYYVSTHPGVCQSDSSHETSVGASVF